MQFCESNFTALQIHVHNPDESCTLNPYSEGANWLLGGEPLGSPSPLLPTCPDRAAAKPQLGPYPHPGHGLGPPQPAGPGKRRIPPPPPGRPRRCQRGPARALGRRPPHTPPPPASHAAEAAEPPPPCASAAGEWRTAPAAPSPQPSAPAPRWGRGTALPSPPPPPPTAEPPPPAGRGSGGLSVRGWRGRPRLPAGERGAQAGSGGQEDPQG